MFRALSFALAATVFVQSGCGGKGEAGTGAAQEGRDVVRPAAYEDLRIQHDLLATSHLADIDYQGLYIDLGTPARMKYTGGNWKTGWGSDHTEGATTYTNVATTGRVYFSVDQPGPLTLRLRLKPSGSKTAMLFLNNRALPSLRFDKGPDYADYDVRVPSAAVSRGENQLLIRFGDTKRVGSEAVSVQLDSIRVIPGEPAASAYTAPEYGKLRANVSLDGEKRAALVLPAPSTISYYVEIPKSGKLGFGIGQQGKSSTANATVSITSDDGVSQSLFSGKATAEWNDRVVPLEKWAGQIVRIQFRSEGAGKVAWSQPAILTPPDKPKGDASKVAKNVVILLIDTLRADKLKPFNPATRVRTPAIDALAGEGAVFTSAQSPENWTRPSVASVLTSLWPTTHGVQTMDAKLPKNATMLSEVFQRSGFKTAMFNANGQVSDKFGFDQGWDKHLNYMRENRSSLAKQLFADAGEWVEANKDKRFFLYIQTIDPHVPYDPPAKYLQMYDAEPYAGVVDPRKTADLLVKASGTAPAVPLGPRDRRHLEALYDGEISYHDEHLGTFVERLKQLGLYDDTMFVIVSDHGEEFHDHGGYGHGRSLYQELINVPLVFRLPGRVPAAKIPTTVSTMDIGPTVLTAAGLPIPKEFEGKSLDEHLIGRTSSRPPVTFSFFLDNQRTVRAGRWKVVLRGTRATLFDLQRDPHEQQELSAESHPIAMRYCRMMIGQFLGVPKLGRWMEPQTGGAQEKLRQENVQIDDTLRKQLQAIGYAN